MSEIVVPVIQQAELAGNYWSKHINFVLKVPGGDESEGGEVRRRFNDFFWLRDWVIRMLPGAFVPAIPPKLPIALWPQGYLAQRKRELQWFLKRCSSIPYIRDNEAYVLFLSSEYNTNFADAIKAFDKTHTKDSRPNQLQNLLTAFSTLNDSPLPEDYETKTKEHLAHIQQVIAIHNRMHGGSEDLGGYVTKSGEMLSQLVTEQEELETTQQEFINDSNYMQRFLTEKKPESKRSMSNIAQTQGMWSKCVSRIWCPVLKKNQMDLQCIEEGMITRDKIYAEYKKAEQVAGKWKTEDAVNNLRANQVDQKHRDLDNEETLKALYEFVVKIVWSHRKMIQQMNQDRWTSGCLTLKKHLVPKFLETKQVMAECRQKFKELKDALPAPAKVPIPAGTEDKNTAEEPAEPDQAEEEEEDLEESTPEKEKSVEPSPEPEEPKEEPKKEETTNDADDGLQDVDI